MFFHKAKLRRYQSPEEYPFTTHFPLPEPILPKAASETDYDHFLFPNNININEKIKDIYIHEIIHRLSKDKQDDDHHYGNSATCDIEALQAISKRIHFGKRKKGGDVYKIKTQFFFFCFF